jgi:hypothetical protein
MGWFPDSTEKDQPATALEEMANRYAVAVSQTEPAPDTTIPEDEN